MDEEEKKVGDASEPEDGEVQSQTITRRQFLIGAGTGLVVGAAGAAGVIAVTMQPQPPTPVTQPQPAVESTAKEAGARLIALKVNGQNYNLEVQSHWTLARVLREQLGLTGTKLACDHGMCGGCSVLLNGTPVYACMQLAFREAGKEVLTIEGLAKDGKLHALQTAFIEGYGTQCGYCASGFLITSKALLDANPNPSVEEIKEALSGNLCRCGSYQQVVESVQSAAKKLRAAMEEYHA